MKNINKELEHHVIVEFKRNGSPILSETHGYVSDIDDIIEYFKKIVEPQIIKTYDIINHKPVNNVYQSKINLNTFFKRYTLEVTFEKSVKTSYNGGMLPKSVFKNPSKGMWLCEPIINLNIKANNAVNAMRIFSFYIGHELTHCYDLLSYAKENDQDPWYNINKNKYFSIKNNMNFGVGNTKAIANMLYNLNRMERNAYIAQLKQELFNIKDTIKDSKSVIYAIKNTDSYKKFLSLNKNMEIILSNTNKDVQNNLINDLNYIMGKKFTTYNQLVKYFSSRWRKWKYKYLSQASKIAYDVFKNGKNQWIDNGMFGKDEIIINNYVR